ncbi:MAG: SIS domain-containing protein [Deltaproteobacteria bacterium]|nr:SIS domain-containing protein [Deltaproteobacteria bacterium]
MLLGKIDQACHDLRLLQDRFFADHQAMLTELCRVMGATLAGGGTIFFFGNGGSAAQAQHLAAEFVNRFLLDRQPLAAMALTSDAAVLTSIANDYDFSDVFRRQLAGLARPGDLAVGISTSGNSANVARALEYAREQRLVTVGFLGRDGGRCRSLCDFPLVVASDQTPRIQEVHLLLGHLLCELVESQLCTRRC